MPGQTTKFVNLTNQWKCLRGAWDRFVEEHPKGSIFHTSPMIQAFRVAKGHRVLPLAAVDQDGEILAMLVSVRVQTLPDPLGRVSSRAIYYAEPLCHDSPESVDALIELIDEHDRSMQRRVVFAEVRPLHVAGPERIALERCGYEYLDYLNYEIDLRQPRSTFWDNLRKSARRGVRRCERRGYRVVKLDTTKDVELLYQFLTLSYGRSQVPLADRSLFEAAFAQLHPRGMLRLLATFEADRPLAVDSLLIHKGRALAWYGGLQRITGVSPFDLLQWHEIVWSKELGCERYDFGGAGWPDEPYGVRDFKAKFGGELVRYGRYRKVYSPWKMALAKRVYELGRTIISPK